MSFRASVTIGSSKPMGAFDRHEYAESAAQSPIRNCVKAALTALRNTSPRPPVRPLQERSPRRNQPGIRPTMSARRRHRGTIQAAPDSSRPLCRCEHSPSFDLRPRAASSPSVAQWLPHTLEDRDPRRRSCSRSRGASDCRDLCSTGDKPMQESQRGDGQTELAICAGPSLMSLTEPRSGRGSPRKHYVAPSS